MKCVIVWFRNDLRVHDHEPLVRAAATGLPVVGLYCFDPRQYAKTSLGFPKTGHHRARFIRESVADLRKQLGELGIKLLVREEKPEEVLSELSKALMIQEIHYHKEIGSEEQELEKLVQAACPSASFYSYWGHNLIHLEDLPFPVDKLPDVFTQFRKQVERKLNIRPLLATPTAVRTVTEMDEGIILTQEQGEPAFRGGETEGKKRLQHYFFETDCLKTYKETRNGMLERNHSSKFSPYLALGCLSPRYIYSEIKRYEKERVSNDSTYWLFFELLWRDYFWLVHWKFDNRLFQKGGLFHLQLPWSTEQAHIDAWIHGQTGYPLIDANMRELQATGFMSNRGRQNVASFLTKNLGIDWRIGAEWFESCLLDYDVSSNYGNWCYSAGVGNDSRVFRVFNVAKQGEDYDPQGHYAKAWLPELEYVPGGKVYHVHAFSEEERERYHLQEYPRPVVDLFASANRQRVRYEEAVRKL